MWLIVFNQTRESLKMCVLVKINKTITVALILWPSLLKTL